VSVFDKNPSEPSFSSDFNLLHAVSLVLLLSIQQNENDASTFLV